MSSTDNTVSASECLALLNAQGILVSDFTLYGYLDSGQIKGYRLPTGTGKKGRWRVDRESVYEFAKKVVGPQSGAVMEAKPT